MRKNAKEVNSEADSAPMNYYNEHDPKAAQWNLSHPIGTPVTRYKLIAPLREGTETKTRSEAWAMGGHSVMVMVEGVSGGVLLESVKPCLSNADLSHRDGEIKP